MQRFAKFTYLALARCCSRVLLELDILICAGLISFADYWPATASRIPSLGATFLSLDDDFRTWFRALARHPAAGGREPPNRAFPCFGLLDYRGWPRRRLHNPRAERMKVKPPSPPSAQSVQTKKKPPVDLAISP
jgi:hypothetical protein